MIIKYYINIKRTNFVIVYNKLIIKINFNNYIITII